MNAYIWIEPYYTRKTAALLFEELSAVNASLRETTARIATQPGLL